MPTAVTSLNPYSFAFNGFVFGGGDSPYQIQSVSGLEGLPELRTQDDNRGYNDGMFSGRDFLGGRTLNVEVWTLPGNGLSAQDNFNVLQSALIPQQQGTGLLQFQLSAGQGLQRLNARVRRRDTVVNPEYTYGKIVSVYQFFCPDPRYYNDTLQSGTMTVSATGGRTYNRVYNLVYPAATLTSVVNVTNDGWATTYPTVTIQGPVINPVVGNNTTGEVMLFSCTLASTDTLTIDLGNQLITLNGNPARNTLLGNSEWLSAPPGVSQFYFTATGSVAGQTLATVTWRSAFI